MALLGRLILILFAILLCIVIFAAGFEFLNAVGMFLSNWQPNAEPRAALLAAFAWGVVFRAPGYMYLGTLPLLLLFLLAEWQSIRVKWTYVIVWAFAGLLATSTASHQPVRFLAAVLAGSASGYLYWMIVERSAGKTIGNPTPAAKDQRLSPFRYVAYAIFCYLAYQSLGYAYYGGQLAWVTVVSRPDPGVPPFRVLHEREMTAAKQVAMWKFPDAESCLEVAQANVSFEKRLTWMNWRAIQNDAEANVCMFRLLGSYRDLSYATAWFEAQGFEVYEQFSSAIPHIERNGTKRVAATHSIRKHGPKFPTRGPVRRLIRSIPYSMVIDATWSPDGKRLLGVNTSYNTL
jgi:hypothetical protein